MSKLHDELWARRFHEVYEELAPSFGYETRTDTREFDPNSKNGKLMIAVCSMVIDEAMEMQRKACYRAFLSAHMVGNGEIEAIRNAKVD